jgi:Ras family protein
MPLLCAGLPLFKSLRVLNRRAVGKSSLTVRFVDHHFVESYYPTIENTFSAIIKHKGQDYATEIVDTAGQVKSLFTPRSHENLT